MIKFSKHHRQSCFARVSRREQSASGRRVPEIASCNSFPKLRRPHTAARSKNAVFPFRTFFIFGTSACTAVVEGRKNGCCFSKGRFAKRGKGQTLKLPDIMRMLNVERDDICARIPSRSSVSLAEYFFAVIIAHSLFLV